MTIQISTTSLKKTDKPINRWFESVYEAIRAFHNDCIEIPFGFFVNECDAGNIEKLNPNRLDYNELNRIVQYCHGAYFSRPSALDFFNEKKRVIPKLSKSLEKLFSECNSAISFGRVEGDIDIALCGQYSSKEAFQIIRENKYVLSEFPIVDWHSVAFFSSINGRGCARKLYFAASVLENSLESARIDTSMIKTFAISDEHEKYLIKAQHKSQLLFGNKQDLNFFQTYRK